MKTVVNKATNIKMQDESGKTEFMDYKKLIQICINNPPKNGWTTDEMRKRIKIEDKLENVEVGGSVELEDAEFEKLLQCIMIPWQFMHKDVIGFEDYLKSL